MELLQRDVYWKTLEKDVKDFVKGCLTCQMDKPDRRRKSNQLHPNEVPSQPWQIISMDMIGPLPESKGFNAIFVIVNRLTKMAYFLPSYTSLTAKGAATLLRDQVFCQHGIPKKI